MRYIIHRIDALDLPNADWERPQWQAAETLEITHFSLGGFRSPSPHSGTRALRRASTIHYLPRRGLLRPRCGRALPRFGLHRFLRRILRRTPARFASLLQFRGQLRRHHASCTAALQPQSAPKAERLKTSATPTGPPSASPQLFPKIVEPERTTPTTWAVEYRVPFALFAQYFGAQTPAPGTQWRGNFYKCGDRTSHPHWGSWAPVDTPEPSFHQPDFYQPLVFA